MLAEDKRLLLDRYEFKKDLAAKVVGLVGSVGTRCAAIILMMGGAEQPLLTLAGQGSARFGAGTVCRAKHPIRTTGSAWLWGSG